MAAAFGLLLTHAGVLVTKRRSSKSPEKYSIMLVCRSRRRTAYKEMSIACDILLRQLEGGTRASAFESPEGSGSS